MLCLKRLRHIYTYKIDVFYDSPLPPSIPQLSLILYCGCGAEKIRNEACQPSRLEELRAAAYFITFFDLNYYSG
jgi:hypothetical protein